MVAVPSVSEAVFLFGIITRAPQIWLKTGCNCNSGQIVDTRNHKLLSIEHKIPKRALDVDVDVNGKNVRITLEH